MPDYQYVTSLNRYRNAQTGRFVPREIVMSYVDQITQAGQSVSDELARLHAEGTITAQDFGAQMQVGLRSSTIQQYVLGRGGRENMQPADWGRVGRQLRGEYEQLRGFVADVETGNLTQAQISARAQLYFNATRRAYEVGQGSAYGVKLPFYPGDMVCRSNCRCHWRLEKVFDEDSNVIAIHAYWEIEPGAQHCEPDGERRGCLQNAREYSPLVIEVA